MMRDIIRVTDLDLVDEFGSTAAIAELSIKIGGHELRLRGAAIVRSNGGFRVSYPRYKDPKSFEKYPSWEPVGDLRREIEKAVLQHWRERRAAERGVSAAPPHEPSDVHLFAGE